MLKATISLKHLVAHFRRNPGTLFIFLFLLFLLFGVIFLIFAQTLYGVEFVRQNYYSFLNTIGVFAYVSLVVGVILQLISFRHRDSDVENSEEDI